MKIRVHYRIYGNGEIIKNHTEATEVKYFTDVDRVMAQVQNETKGYVQYSHYEKL